MSKNGLFLISIGCLILMFSANAQTAVYDIFSMVTAVTLILSGIFMLLKDKTQKKSR